MICLLVLDESFSALGVRSLEVDELPSRLGYLYCGLATLAPFFTAFKICRPRRILLRVSCADATRRRAD